MAKRGYDISVKCTHDGCVERDRYHFDTQADMRQHFQRQPASEHKCLRHVRPNEVLSVTNLITVYEMQNFQIDSGKFWGTVSPFSGFTSGPGFKAYAADFPPGARLRVTAQVIMPVLAASETSSS